MLGGARRLLRCSPTLWFAAAALAAARRRSSSRRSAANAGTLAVLAACALVCVVAPICEELLFRGFIFRSLVELARPVAGGADHRARSSALVHGLSAPAVDLVPLALLGFVLCGDLPAVTGSLYPCIALHVLNNAIALRQRRALGRGRTVELRRPPRSPRSRSCSQPCDLASARWIARDRLIALLREHALVLGDVVLTSGATRLLLRRRQARDPAAGGLRGARRAGRRAGRAVGRHRGRRDDDGRRPVACAALAGGFAGKAFFVRKEVKAHGLARRIEGRCSTPDERCVVVEDVVSTGGSTLRAIEALREAGHADLRRDRGARPPDGRRRGDRGGGRRARTWRSRRSTTSTRSARG